MERLPSLPVSIFGSTVALAGLGAGFRTGHSLYGLPLFFGALLTYICWVTFAALIIAYTLKWVHYRSKVLEELRHPVTAHFAGTFFISAVLISGLTVNYSMTAGRVIWLAGAGGGLLFMYVLTERLFSGNLSATNTMPALLIPGLTTLNAATAEAVMKFGNVGNHVDMFLFSIGIIYTFTFFVLIAYRMTHYDPLSNFLKPSFLLMCAPFEIGFQTYVSITRQVDLFASVIFYFGLFIYVVIFFLVFTKSLTFELSWWGACFSTGALTNAALRYAAISGDTIIRYIGGIMLLALTGLVLITAYYSLRQLFFPRQGPPPVQSAPAALSLSQQATTN